MDWILIILSLSLLSLGVLGAVLPALPGPPLAWLGLLVFYFTDFSSISLSALIASGVLAAVFTWADYYLPIALVRKWGGTEYGKRGALAGLLVGFFFAPWGIVLGPPVGAYMFERFGAKLEHREAYWSAFGSLMGFLLGTAGKMLYALVTLVWVLYEWVA